MPSSCSAKSVALSPPMNCPFLSYTPASSRTEVTSDASATSYGSSTTDARPFPSQRVVCFYGELTAIERVGVEPLHGIRRPAGDRAQERTVDIEANGVNRPASRRLDLRDDAHRADGAGAAERRRDPHVHIVRDGRRSSPGRSTPPARRAPERWSGRDASWSTLYRCVSWSKRQRGCAERASLLGASTGDPSEGVRQAHGLEAHARLAITVRPRDLPRRRCSAPSCHQVRQGTPVQQRHNRRPP